MQRQSAKEFISFDNQEETHNQGQATIGSVLDEAVACYQNKVKVKLLSKEYEENTNEEEKGERRKMLEMS